MSDPIARARSEAPPTEDQLAELLVALGPSQASPGAMRDAREAAHQALAATPGLSWTDALEHAGASVGLRVGWVLAPASTALPQARPDRPLVTRRLGTWVVVDRWRLGRARTRQVPGAPTPRWLGEGVAPLPDAVEGAQVWAVIEPALPASALATSRNRTSPLPPLGRLGALLRAERQDLGAILLYAIGIGVLGLATPLVMQVLINWLAFGALLQPLVALAVGLLLCLALAAGLRVLQRVAVEMVQRRIFIRIAADVAGRLSRLRASAFDGRSGPEVVNRLFDAITVQKATSSLMLDGSAAALQALVGLMLLAAYHPVLLAFDVLVIGAFAGVFFALGRGGTRSAIYESKAKYKVAGWIEEVARHPGAFRLGGAGRLAVEQADTLLSEWHQRRRDHFRVYLRQVIGSQVVQVLASAVLLVLCGSLVLDGELTLGQLVAAEFVVTAMLAGFAKFTGKLDIWYDLLAGIDKLGELIDLPCDEPRGLSRAPEGPAKLQLEGLSDAGGTARSLDLVIHSGHRVSLLVDEDARTGPLAEVMVGLREPLAGALLRDGIDSRSWHPDALHAGASLAAGPAALHASVLDNVALSRPGIDSGRAWEALESVGLAGAIRAMPDGIDTVLDPSGAPLSQPQVIRLELARAIAHRPQLLVVDGLLDQLPPGMRSRMLSVLLARRAPWTLVVFTRDPATAMAFPTRVDLREEPVDV